MQTIFFIRLFTFKYFLLIYCQQEQSSSNIQTQPPPFRPLGSILLCQTETGKLKCNANSKYSEIDGACNNLKNPWVGKKDTPFKRYLKNTYDDELKVSRQHSVNRSPLPNPRVISRSISTDRGQTESQVTHLLTLFGQFLAHDFALSNFVPGLLLSYALTLFIKKILLFCRYFNLIRIFIYRQRLRLFYCRSRLFINSN